MNASVAEETVVSKGAFASMIGVSKGRVSQYIADGKLTGSSLVGRGRTAKVRVERACEELRMTLDISQRLGNGIDTKLDLDQHPQRQPVMSHAAAPAPAPVITPQERKPPETLSAEAQIKQERLKSLQFANRKAAVEEEAASGRFILAADAQAQMTGIAGQMLQVFEGGLADFASAISEQFKVPHRDALHLLKAQFRVVRERAAKQARQQMEEQQKTDEIEIGDTDE